MKPLIAISIALSFAGCNPTPDGQKLTYSVANKENSDRFKITKVSTFDDSTAYLGKRDVFIIVDTVTGSEFVGISGVGVSATGSHGTGKHSTAMDER